MADIYFYELDEIPQNNMPQPQNMAQMHKMMQMMQMQQMHRMGRPVRHNNSNKSAAVCILVILIIIIIIIIFYVFYRNNYNNYYGYKNGFMASPEAIRDFNKVKTMDPKSPYTEFKLNIPNYDASKHQYIKQKLNNNTLTADDFDNA